MIIGISGKKQSGKDLVAKVIIALIKEPDYKKWVNKGCLLKYLIAFTYFSNEEWQII